MISRIIPNPSIRGTLLDYIHNTKVLQKNGLKIAIIDADSIIYSICVDKKQEVEQIEAYGLQSERTLEQVQEELNNYFLNILMTTGCIEYVALLTGGSHRYSFYPEYKANRKAAEKPRFLKEIRNYAIDALGFLQVEGYEADDLVNMCNEFYVKANRETLLVHTDKDLDQIVGNHYNYKKNEFYNIDEDQAAYNLWTQIITGDSTDNIKGIPGKGVKFSEKVLSNLNEFKPSIYAATVLQEYVTHFSEYEGIEEFTKNYKLIKLLDLGKTNFIFNTTNIEDKLDLDANLNI